jgi:hypothetical protein
MTPWSVKFVADAGDPRAPGLTLGRAFAIFSRQPTAHSLALGIVVLAGLRVHVGDFSWWDLAVLAGLVAIEPFSEWLIHVNLLHFRPRKVLGIDVDLHMAKAHRMHHQAPHDPHWWFIPKPSAVVGFCVLALGAWLLAPTLGLAITFVGGTLAAGLTYEWIHYLCHSSYRPRGRWYKAIEKHHRLHHFKNEHYWMGVTMHIGDRVLGTMKDVAEVETSPTCRNLLDDG